MKMGGIKFYDDYCEFVCSGKTGESRFDANTLALKECPFCSIENPGDGGYCYKCGKPLSVK